MEWKHETPDGHTFTHTVIDGVRVDLNRYCGEGHSGKWWQLSFPYIYLYHEDADKLRAIAPEAVRILATARAEVEALITAQDVK